MNFLEGVNRVLRLEAVLQGDDDDLTSFSLTQHAATSSLAQLAIQAQLADLVSDGFIDYEDAQSTFVTTNLTRTYTLASDFQRMQELFMEELDSSSEASGTRVVHYPGGEAQLRADFPRYQEDTGRPIYFYLTGGTSKTIGLMPVPTDTYTYRYYYEKDVSVSAASDTLPFVNEIEAQTFIHMCARHFKYLKASSAVREQLFPAGIAADPVILHARATLVGLLYGLPKRRKYGKRYG